MDYHQVTQTKFTNFETGECGNCFQACLASLLKLPIEEVIDTGILAQNTDKSGNAADDFWEPIHDWLYERGYELSLVVNPAVMIEHPDVLYILTGTSPRFANVHHSVIARAGEILWDPHPSRDGIVDFVDIMLLEKISNINTEHANDRT